MLERDLCGGCYIVERERACLECSYLRLLGGSVSRMFGLILAVDLNLTDGSDAISFVGVVSFSNWAYAFRVPLILGNFSRGRW